MLPELANTPTKTHIHSSEMTPNACMCANDTKSPPKVQLRVESHTHRADVHRSVHSNASTELVFALLRATLFLNHC